MKVTKDIMELLGVDESTANEVRDFIDSWYGLDWSEATQREVNRTVILAYRDMNDMKARVSA